jgi:hypothetical protein
VHERYDQRTDRSGFLGQAGCQSQSENLTAPRIRVSRQWHEVRRLQIVSATSSYGHLGNGSKPLPSITTHARDNATERTRISTAGPLRATV